MLFLWHGIIKYSIWKGISYYENKKFTQSIRHLELVTSIYPKKISKFYLMLADMYYLIGDKEEAKKNAVIANEINPNYNAPKEILHKINNSNKIK